MLKFLFQVVWRNATFVRKRFLLGNLIRWQEKNRYAFIYILEINQYNIRPTFVTKAQVWIKYHSKHYRDTTRGRVLPQRNSILCQISHDGQILLSMRLIYEVRHGALQFTVHVGISFSHLVPTYLFIYASPSPPQLTDFNQCKMEIAFKIHIGLYFPLQCFPTACVNVLGTFICGWSRRWLFL